MDWIDYREKLGIGFDDKEKSRLFYSRMSNALDVLISSCDAFVTITEYNNFCMDTGTRLNLNVLENYQECERFRDCVRIIRDHETVFNVYLAYFVWFINSLSDAKGRNWNRQSFKRMLLHNLKEAHIQFDLLEDGNKFFVFPKGASELDNALVSEPLEWLRDYPLAHKTFVIALKQYSDGIYIRDVADNLRKALEAFLQEFLGNEKNLETNKNEICRYLGEQGVDPGITGLFQPLINAYKNINDKIAKHNDAVDAKLLKFLLYQTGVLIRMVLSVKQAQDMEGNDNAH
ncbi:MAG: hypothetical protein DBX45_02630 [Oscillospiraceae bacterium]|jgi:hypothetical protein|nr:MAG: hypothetical protein DBX45_02630 [Oscillospiraceae bacterium]